LMPQAMKPRSRTKMTRRNTAPSCREGRCASSGKTAPVALRAHRALRDRRIRTRSEGAAPTDRRTTPEAVVAAFCTCRVVTWPVRSRFSRPRTSAASTVDAVWRLEAVRPRVR
jgi:hypothetical protein